MNGNLWPPKLFGGAVRSSQPKSGYTSPMRWSSEKRVIAGFFLAFLSVALTRFISRDLGMFVFSLLTFFDFALLAVAFYLVIAYSTRRHRAETAMALQQQEL